RVWLLVTAHPLRNAADAVTQVILTFMDITARQEAEAALRESEQTFRLLVEAAPIGIYTTGDAQSRYVTVNDAFCALTGYSRDELIGMEVIRLYPAEQWETLRAEFHRRFTQDVREQREFTLLTKGGERCTILGNGVTVAGPDGQRQRLSFV